MASTGAGGTLPPNFLLTPQQQGLLFAALNSNKQQQISNPSGPSALSLSPTSFENSPVQSKPAQTHGYHESPYLDNYDYDFGDSSFDFSFASNHDEQARMIGDIPTSGTVRSDSTENDGNEGNEKRSHPDDEDDEDSPGNDPKRRESTEKVPKKPGRKPLTSEPSSKRKAQNRAAQRAFRERKEKHLKDLETKVEELEKASEAANHENGRLRAQVDRITGELNQYKSRISLMTNPKAIPREKVPFGNAAVNNLSDVNFQFEFPKFGMLPGPPAANKQQKSGSQPTSPHQQVSATTPSNNLNNGNNSPLMQHKDDLAKFSGVFSPSMSSSATNISRASLDSGNYSVGGATSSPSASSHSNTGPSSSCGTSPEPFMQSPMGFKPVEMLTTIGEEHPSMYSSIPNKEPVSQFSNVDLSSTNFDWLAQQNGGQFDPQLFGDYREPQESVLSNPSFDDFFNDALDTDFFTPYNVAPSPNLAKNAPAIKKNLIDEIDAQQDMDEEPLKKSNMNCNELWEKLQACPKAQNGEFDLDGLCSELTKKAKCSGTGPVVGETDFDTILAKYMGKEISKSCVAEQLGVEIKSDDKARILPSAAGMKR
ncbi:transcription factor PAP1-domain-containing protein [Dactylonectria macrodidyma]|uniref:Transcription factor PAP1-domain-containing protein n=1 Tax=Dactylonectria macrodidyma TaxID=307937 RepID=A0A9P9FTA3_9HYPO|nr:transcription factor PAP1-domain-containing protein [Dactylonectria macrodidyma]